MDAQIQRGEPAAPHQASQKPISKIRISVVRTAQGAITTSTLSLRIAGMSLSTFGSRSKNRWRLRKMYAPPNKLTSRGDSKGWQNCRINLCKHTNTYVHFGTKAIQVCWSRAAPGQRGMPRGVRDIVPLVP